MRVILTMTSRSIAARQRVPLRTKPSSSALPRGRFAACEVGVLGNGKAHSVAKRLADIFCPEDLEALQLGYHEVDKVLQAAGLMGNVDIEPVTGLARVPVRHLLGDLLAV